MSVSPFLDQEAQRLHKRRNLWHSGLLLGGIGALVALSTWLVFGWSGVVWSLAAVGVVFAFAPRIPPETIMRMYRARRVSSQEGGQLQQIVELLARRAELPAAPRLYVIPSMMLNA